MFTLYTLQHEDILFVFMVCVCYFSLSPPLSPFFHFFLSALSCSFLRWCFLFIFLFFLLSFLFHTIATSSWVGRSSTIHSIFKQNIVPGFCRIALLIGSNWMPVNFFVSLHLSKKVRVMKITCYQETALRLTCYQETGLRLTCYQETGLQ